MKPLPGKIRSTIVLVLTLALFVAVFSASKGNRHVVTCKGLVIGVRDSAERNFISRNDVRIGMAGYGDFLGQRIDEVDLARIEKILCGKSAIRTCEAWITDDGILHVDVTQRIPVVRFQKGDAGFYADKSGYIFPLQSKFTSMVPIVDGQLPLSINKDFKGELSSEKEREWVNEVIAMIAYMDKSRLWSGNISQMTVSKGGDLTLIPREGRERFIFGSPTSVKEKFSRIAGYYEAIAPLDKGYTSVDVRYSGRIICK